LAVAYFLGHPVGLYLGQWYRVRRPTRYWSCYMLSNCCQASQYENNTHKCMGL